MADYWLSEAGQKLFKQVNARWPKRDHASDGWIGDASHAATKSDHNPCWTCSGDRYGVVRAVDIDASMGGGPSGGSSAVSWRLANHLRKAMIDGDGRVEYIIAADPNDKKSYICSMNPAYQPRGKWRPYTGDSHWNHIHVSFTSAGDFRGRRFNLPILNELEVKRLRKVLSSLGDLKDKLVARLKRVNRRIRRTRRRKDSLL